MGFEEVQSDDGSDEAHSMLFMGVIY